MQDEGEAIYCIVDLHAITVEFDPADLRERLYDTTAILIAAGLDPSKCILFRQSDVAEHTELCWMLASVTAYGELQRMHQFKEKSEQQKAFVSAGLLFYPILQAADILAYQADEVPVGEDQKQHLEISRNIAERFNARYGETFVVPTHRIPKVASRVMDLQTPDKKMSTTGGTPQGTVLVLDEPETIRRKFKSAVTDTGREIVYDPEHKPGISNLLSIYSALSGETVAELERRYEGHGYGDLKKDLGQVVADFTTPIRERTQAYLDDPAELDKILAVGAEKARMLADATLRQVYDRVGFLPAAG
jgi:tryptophanyl-tRNA synthetase